MFESVRGKRLHQDIELFAVNVVAYRIYFTIDNELFQRRFWFYR